MKQLARHTLTVNQRDAGMAWVPTASIPALNLLRKYHEDLARELPGNPVTEDDSMPNRITLRQTVPVLVKRDTLAAALAMCVAGLVATAFFMAGDGNNEAYNKRIACMANTQCALKRL